MQGPVFTGTNLVWLERDDGAEGEDERMHVFLVEKESGDGVGDRVVSQHLRLLAGQATHVLGVKLHRVIAQLRLVNSKVNTGDRGALRLVTNH